MKNPLLGFTLATTVLLTSCAYVPLDPLTERRVSPDYTASGGIVDARAYVYANHTVVDFDRREPTGLIIRDASGASVPFEKVGRLYRLDRRLDQFTLWLNGTSTTFEAVATTRLYSVVPGNALNTALNTAPVPLQAKDATILRMKAVVPDSDVSELLRISERQLAEVRGAINASSKNPNTSSAERQALNDRMDAIEARLISAAAAIVRISFPSGGTDFKPPSDIGRALIASAKAATAVNVHGHTDARIAGPADAKIALGRALSARMYLLKNGISTKKISVFSTAEGDFAAPNSAANGRAMNRRVEIEFVNAQIGLLKRQTLKLAGG